MDTLYLASPIYKQLVTAAVHRDLLRSYLNPKSLEVYDYVLLYIGGEFPSIKVRLNKR